jgi:heterodisulfide reductase subunit A
MMIPTAGNTGAPTDNRQSAGSSRSALIAGGGIVGMQAALDLAESGYQVFIVERSPGLGGTMAQLDKTFPTNECAM